MAESNHTNQRTGPDNDSHLKREQSMSHPHVILVPEGIKPVLAWKEGVHFDDNTIQRLIETATLPVIHHHVAAMPDSHVGYGATIGSVIPTYKAVIPSAVGVDIGCGMMALKLEGITANDLTEDLLKKIYAQILRDVPVGFDFHRSDRYNEHGVAPIRSLFNRIIIKHPDLLAKRKNTADEIISSQFGTLGGGNHFIEICIDENQAVWIMLHSGSRGIGNAVGSYFIDRAGERADKLNWLTEDDALFNDYIEAVSWAQEYAAQNRAEIMRLVFLTIHRHVPTVAIDDYAPIVQCHHNYVSKEHHYCEDVYVTRKGAISAREGELGIIPGSMGAKSFIVRGLGNPLSFNSSSHGAGRVLSRTKAKLLYNRTDLAAQTQGVICSNKASIVDEIPAAYKDIDAVMAAQSDLTEIVHTLKQVLNVKG